MSEYNLYQVINSYSAILSQRYNLKKMDMEKYVRMNNKIKQWIHYLYANTQ